MTPTDRKADLGYEAIAGELRERIDSGDLPPDAKVPGEKSLMATYGVSRDTASKALQLLKDEGVIVSRQGAPTRVRKFERIRRQANKRLSAQVWGEGVSMWAADVVDKEPEVLDLEVGRIPADERIARLLGVEVGEPVVRRGRRYALDGRPVMAATSYIPVDLADGTRIEDEDTGPGGVYARLKEAGHAPTLLPEEIRCRMPSTREKEQLAMGRGTPVIEITRRAIEEGGRVVEVADMVLDSSSYVLEYVTPA